MTTKYRNVTVQPDGAVTGEQRLANYTDRWMLFTASPVLALIREAFCSSETASRLLWSIQDGMPGISGDEAEWDWSALRDSSARAQLDLFDAAETFVPRGAMASKWGVDPNALERAIAQQVTTLRHHAGGAKPRPAVRYDVATGETTEIRRGPDTR